MDFEPEEFSLPAEPAPSSAGLNTILDRLNQTLQRDALVQDTTRQLRQSLQVDRVVLYYFYRRWEGQVTFEALSNPRLSIYGSKGPDQCFNGDYAALYLAGRVRAIPDITVEPMADCHRDFLQDLQVKANLVVPVITESEVNSPDLWGLLIAHHCQTPRTWADAEITLMQAQAQILATAPSVVGPHPS
jgi:GAF domain-containing protein